MHRPPPIPAPSTARPGTDAPPRRAKRFFLRGDGRSREARRLIALTRAYAAAAVRPAGACSAAVDATVRALALVTLRLEILLAAQARNEPVDDASVVALGNLQSRLLERLGLAPAVPEPERPDPRTTHGKPLWP